MGWIINGLCEVLVSLLGDILTFLLSCISNFELDIGYSPNTELGAIFSPSYYQHASGIIDSVFPEAVIFFPLFVYMAYIILIMGMLWKYAAAAYSPNEAAVDHPFLTTGKGIVAGIGILYSYTLFILVERIANGFYLGFKEVTSAITSQELPALSDYLSNPQSFIGDGDVFSKVAFFVIEIGLFAVLLMQFLRLLLEAFERYLTLAVLFYTCPLAFSTLVFKGNEIFKKWVQMVLTAYLVLFLNLFFLGLFYSGFIHVFAPADTGALEGLGNSLKSLSNAYSAGVVKTSTSVFANGTEFVLKMMILIAVLTVGQKVDELLRTLGFSTAQTGHGLGSAVAAGVVTSMSAARNMAGAIRGGARGLENMEKTRRQSAENKEAKSFAESILRGANDAHDTVRANATSSELAANMAGTKGAMTSDIVGSDNQRPVFGDDATRQTLNDMGVNAPAYGNAEMTDGKATFRDGNGQSVYEVGDAKRWQTPDGVASFTQTTKDGNEVVRAASQSEINSASEQMVSTISSNTSLSDGVTWENCTDEYGNSTGLAIGYGADGGAKYAASLDGVATVDSDYGGITSYTDTQGNENRMSSVPLAGGEGISYSVHSLDDAEHQSKHFGNLDNFKENGVTFNKPATSSTLVHKSVSMQDAYSLSHAKDKQVWKASDQSKKRDISQAKRTLSRIGADKEQKREKAYAKRAAKDARREKKESKKYK